ncbi:MAG: porphobilinogen synthase [Candidatus Babeliaceae bacterium]|nr:porphobilinogen synthase [Candidatus Babeliaceae bacterium]
MKRFRELRTSAAIRDKYAEVSIKTSEFIYPYFVVDGTNVKQPITSLHGIARFSIDEMLIDMEETVSLGIEAVLIFGVIEEKEKDENGTAAYLPGSIVAKAVKAIKEKYPAINVITDVCLCGYTTHGHCGIIHNSEIMNDSTLPLLAQMALRHAEAGADFVAPSAMMDGQVEAIRRLLDEKGYAKTKILSYSAKYSSGFYGPFRDAAQSAPSFGDRKTYQMDYRSIDQAIGEVAADIEEGAAWVMVKPAHTYLDIIQRIKSTFSEVPLVAYHVSGEYMMIKAAAHAGLMNEETAMLEALIAIKRAGADYIISYYAKDFAKLYNHNRHLYGKIQSSTI